MAEEAKPAEVTAEPKTVETPVEPKMTTSTTVEAKKSSSALPKVLIIVVILICLCVTCLGVIGYFITRSVGSVANVLEGSLNSVGTANTGSNGSDNSNNNGGTTTYNSTDGNGSFSVGTSLPATFPTDIPIYAGATASYSSTTTSSDGKPEVSATFTLKGNASDVVAFYKSKMAANGYTLNGEVNFLGNLMTFDNASREVIVSVIGSDTESDIVLSIVATNK